MEKTISSVSFLDHIVSRTIDILLFSLPVGFIAWGLLLFPLGQKLLDNPLAIFGILMAISVAVLASTVLHAFRAAGKLMRPHTKPEDINATVQEWWEMGISSWVVKWEYLEAGAHWAFMVLVMLLPIDELIRIAMVIGLAVTTYMPLHTAVFMRLFAGRQIVERRMLERRKQ